MEQRMKDKTHSLKITLIIAFLVLSLVVLLIYSSLNIYFSYQIQKQLIDTNQVRISKDASSTVEGFIQEKLKILKSGVKLNNIVLDSQYQQKVILERLIGFEPSFKRLSIMDADGEKLQDVSRLSSLQTIEIDDQVKSDIYIKVKHGIDYISPVFIDEQTSEPMVILGVDITNLLGDFKGVLLAEVNLKFMWDLVDSIRVGDNGLAYVVDNKGELIAFEDIARVLKRENLSYLDEIREFLSSRDDDHKDTTHISRGILGNYVVTTHEHLELTDWAVVVEMPVREAYSPIFKQIRLSIFTLLAILTLTIIGGVYLSRRITNPLINLRNAALSIGNGNLDTDITIKTQDEIGELAHAFESMTHNLKRSRQQLEDYSKNLEEKVKERTGQLESKNEELEKFNKIFENALDGIVVADAKTGILLDCNPAACELVGRKRSELVGKHQSILHPKNVGGEDPNTFKKHLNEKEGQILETKVITKDGKIKDVAIKASLFEFGGKKLIHGIFRDITEKKRYEDQLLKANTKLKDLDKQKDAFISIGAHELKTPLTSIKGFAQILRNDQLDAKKRHNFVELINKNSNRLYNLILDLVDSSRINLGQIKIEKEIVDPYKILEDIKENMEGQIRDKGIQPIFSADKGLPTIQTDYERLLQVLRNLVVNAIHYTQKGTISVRIYKEGGYVQFEVKDTGQGIPKDAQKKLFSRFYQVDSSMRRKVGGSGLGLSVCKGLVELMKGRIWFESDVGKGTTFYFRLPIKKEVEK